MSRRCYKWRFEKLIASWCLLAIVLYETFCYKWFVVPLRQLSCFTHVLKLVVIAASSQVNWQSFSVVMTICKLGTRRLPSSVGPPACPPDHTLQQQQQRTTARCLNTAYHFVFLLVHKVFLWRVCLKFVYSSRTVLSGDLFDRGTIKHFTHAIVSNLMVSVLCG